jgi:hypothetical protein
MGGVYVSKGLSAPPHLSIIYNQPQENTMARRRVGRRKVKTGFVGPGSFNDQLDLDIGAMEREQNRITGAMVSQRDTQNARVNSAGKKAFKRRRG